MQFAQDRKYEEAWIIPLNSSQPTEDIIKEYISRPHTLLIVEYIWNSTDDANRFVLTFFLDNKCKLQDPLEFIYINLELFYSKPKFDVLISTLDEKIVGHTYLLNSKPETANMSVFNHWLSVGPVELWNKGEVIDDEHIVQKIEARPEILRSKLNYQGLLFRFNISGKEDGPSYGVKTPSCIKIGDEWKVDTLLVITWLKKFII